MLSLPGPFDRRRQLSLLQSLDFGDRMVTFRVTSAERARARVRGALDPEHPYRPAALELVSETVIRALACASASGAPLRVGLTVSPSAVRVEVRGAGVVEAAGIAGTAGRLATRSGIAVKAGASEPTLWWAFGEPLSGEELVRP